MYSHVSQIQPHLSSYIICAYACIDIYIYIQPCSQAAPSLEASAVPGRNVRGFKFKELEEGDGVQ